MLAILNSLNAHNFPIFQPILMIFVSKFMVRRVLYDKTYLSLGLLSPLKKQITKVLIRLHGCAGCGREITKYQSKKPAFKPRPRLVHVLVC